MEADQTKAGNDPPLDLNGFALTDDEVATPGGLGGGNLSPRRRERLFLRGPVNLAWLDRAARLPGKALAVGLVLWFKHGLTGAKTVTLCLERIGFGVSDQAGRRALQALADAGLVSVIRNPGRGLEVTILDSPDYSRHAAEGQ